MTQLAFELSDAALRIAAVLSGTEEVRSGMPRRYLLATHMQPDGDAIGSVFALGHIIRHFGGDMRLLIPEDIPPMCSWLSPPGVLVRDVAALQEWTPDVMILADCGDEKRSGALVEGQLTGKAFVPGWEQVASVNIDHHKGNPEFATYNWVEHSWAATGLMAGALAEYLGLPLTGDLGEALYLTLVSDTGNFCFANTSAESLAMASRIVAGGLKVGEFTTKADNNWSLGRMHLWGDLMGNISLHDNGTVACCITSLEARQRFGCGKADLEGFASWLRKIQGVEVALFIREDGPERCKISLRSMGDRDVRVVAAAFGGGGHTAAAGAQVLAGPEQTRELVLQKLLAD